MPINMRRRFRKRAMSGKRYHPRKEQSLTGSQPVRTGKRMGQGMDRLLAEKARAREKEKEASGDAVQGGVGASEVGTGS